MNKRINEFILTLGITVSEFERMCNLSNGAVSKMGDNTRTSTIDKISKIFPSLNIVWLRTGEGEMLKESMSPTSRNDYPSDTNDGSNHMVSSVLLDKALDEIAAMRQALTTALTENQKNTERLLSIIENMNK